MMNSPFVIEQAKAYAKRPELANETTPAVKIKKIYLALFNRAPTQDELSLSLRFFVNIEQIRLTSPNAEGLTPWEEYLQAQMMTNEFCFVD